MPRFRVGASSEVTARAVSSLTPAPAPAIAIPAARCISVSFLLRGRSEHTSESVHGMGRGTYNEPKDDHSSAEYCDIPATYKV